MLPLRPRESKGIRECDKQEKKKKDSKDSPSSLCYVTHVHPFICQGMPFPSALPTSPSNMCVCASTVVLLSSPAPVAMISLLADDLT